MALFLSNILYSNNSLGATVVAGTNLTGGGTLATGNSVTLNLSSNIVSLTSVQTSTMFNDSGHAFTFPSGGTQELVGTVATQNLTNKTFANTTVFDGDVLFNTRLKERVTVQSSAASGTVNFNAIDSGILYYTTAATGNWTLNIRGDASTDLDSIMSSGESLSLVFLATNGAQNWKQSNTHIDGSYRNMHWQGASEPTGANNSIESYSITVVKTAANTFTVLGSKTQFQRTETN